MPVASATHPQCSAYVRQWALERWPENCEINLERDIEAVKEEIRQINRGLVAQVEEAADAYV